MGVSLGSSDSVVLRLLRFISPHTGMSEVTKTDLAEFVNCPKGSQGKERKRSMVLILLALLVVVLFGLGFAVHLLWIAAAVFAIVWIASFALGKGEGASRRSLRR